MLVYKNKITINRDLATVFEYFSRKETMQLFIDDATKPNETFVFEDNDNEHIEKGYIYKAKFSSEEFVADIIIEVVDIIPNQFYKYKIKYEFIEDKEASEDDVNELNEVFKRFFPSLSSTIEFIPKSKHITTVVSKSYIDTPRLLLKMYFKLTGISWYWKDKKLYQYIKNELENT